MALSLARTGASRQANHLLGALVSEGHGDEETVGMLARTYKDLWATSPDARERREYLESAFRWYLHAHQRSHGYWSGINAATMALLLGDEEQAAGLARHVRAGCLEHRRADPSGGDRYWLAATLGEAALILRDQSSAVDWYREAVEKGGHGLGDLVSTRRNARLILRHQETEAPAIEACFPIPRVAVFAGHLIDRPDREAVRFPPGLEGAVRRELMAALRRLDVGIGYASAANGGDILFLECAGALGAERHIVLPYNREQFSRDCVAFIPGSNWAARYQALLEQAASVTIASEQRMTGRGMSYEYGFRLLDGASAVRAEELDTELVCLAVWDGQAGDGPAGTAAAVEYWQRAKRQIEIVDLRSLTRPAISTLAPVGAGETSDEGGRPSAFEARIVGLLFADVAGFSRLAEAQIPIFIEHYLGEVARVLRESVEKPLLTNTWGDGLYFVFQDVRETGAFALRLGDALRAIDWTTFGLPGGLGLRIAVHAGPAYACTDPVTGRPNFLGAHVSLAARIEPVTPPGEVYGSGAFAALAKSAGVREFACAYVGQTPLAKGAGTMPMYVVRRKV
jgi:class 3 adenylate cyclase